MGAGRGGSEVFNFVFWLLVLIFISFWVAGICFFPFLIVSILVPCINGLKDLQDFLLKCLLFPAKCSDNLVHRRAYNEV